MAVSHNGKKPGVLWYFQKRCGLIMKSFGHKDTKVDAQIMAGDTGIAALWVAGGIAALSIPQLALVPFLVPVAAGAAGVGGLVYGVKSWLGLRTLNKSTTAYYYMKDAEEKWLAKKMRPPLMTRISTSIKNGLNKTTAVLLSPLNMFKAKPKKDKATPAPSASSPAVPSAPMPAIGDSFAAAQTPAPAPTAEEIAAEEARKARAQARADRKAKGGTRFN